MHGGVHLFRLFHRERERFFAENVLSVFRGGDGDFRMRIVRRVNVHDVDERRFHNIAPVGGGMFPTELRAGGLNSGGITSANRMQLHMRLEGEKSRRLPPRVRVGLAHEAVTDHPDAQSFGHIKVEVELLLGVFIVAKIFQVNE